MTILEKVKVLINQVADEDTLEVLIELCKEDAVNYCNLSEYIEDLDNIVVRMVIEKYNKLGFEGLSQQSTSAVSNSFIESYSTEILSALTKFRKIRVIK